MSKQKGGKFKPSDALLATSGGLGVASAGLGLSGIGAAAVPLTGALSGISFGVSRLLKAFGAGLSSQEIKRLKEIKAIHDKGGNISKTMLNSHARFINKIMKKHGSGISTGGQLKTAGGISTGGSLKSGGSVPKMTVGSKLQVYRGTAQRTSGGLTRKDLIKNKRGKIVSKKKSELLQKRFREGKLGIKPKSKEELAKIRNK